jgi:hypothetical protein
MQDDVEGQLIASRAADLTDQVPAENTRTVPPMERQSDGQLTEPDPDCA